MQTVKGAKQGLIAIKDDLLHTLGDLCAIKEVY